MKKYVTLITAMFCLMFVFGLNTKAATYKNFKYIVKNGGVVITGFTDPDAVNVSIPSMIDGKKVTEIGTYQDEWGNTRGAFECFRNLKSVTIPNTMKIIGKNAFSECSALTSITIPNTVKTIGKGAFYRCDSLTSVTIPGSVTSIGMGAFIWCPNLRSVNISKGVKTIGKSAFSGCNNLTKVTIPGSVTTIGGEAFYMCRKLKNITIPASVTSIGDNAFYECRSLKSINIPKGVKTIGNSAFEWCKSLTSVTIPGSVSSIGNSAFMFCSKLKSVKISKGLKTIGVSAFFGCDNLKSITIPKSVVHMDECGLGKGSYKSGNGKRFKGFKIKGYYDSGAEKYAENEKIKFIPLNRRYRAPKIGSSRTVDYNVYVITSANTVRFKKPLFSYIDSTKVPNEIKIRGKTYKVTAIAKKAFSKCKDLEKVTIKSQIKRIGKYAFYKCKKLKTIKIYSTNLTENSVLTGAFKGINKKAAFYVPKSKIAAYKKIFLKRGAKETMKFKTN